MNPLVRLTVATVVITAALAVLLPVLCQFVTATFIPIVVLAVLVIAGRVIWWYTQN